MTIRIIATRIPRVFLSTVDWPVAEGSDPIARGYLLASTPVQPVAFSVDNKCTGREKFSKDCVS